MYSRFDLFHASTYLRFYRFVHQNLVKLQLACQCKRRLIDSSLNWAWIPQFVTGFWTKRLTCTGIKRYWFWCCLYRCFLFQEKPTIHCSLFVVKFKSTSPSKFRYLNHIISKKKELYLFNDLENIFWLTRYFKIDKIYVT